MKNYNGIKRYTDWENVPVILTVAETCNLLQVCEQTVWKLIKAKRIQAVKVDKKYIVTKSAVMEFLGL